MGVERGRGGGREGGRVRKRGEGIKKLTLNCKRFGGWGEIRKTIPNVESKHEGGGRRGGWRTR